MQKQLLSLALLTASGFGVAQAGVILNEDFSDSRVAYAKYENLSQEGWEAYSTNPTAVKPQLWCLYGAGSSSDVNVKACSDGDPILSSGGVVPRDEVLYTPTLNLDDTYRLSFVWSSSPAGRDSKDYKFQVKVVEEGKSFNDGDLIFDFQDPDLMRESGLTPDSYGYWWMGWADTQATISLAKWKGKKVRIAFIHHLSASCSYPVYVDNVKVESFVAATQPEASLSTDKWNFGNVYVGSQMRSDVITLTNTGTDGLKITGVEGPEGFAVAFSKKLEDIDLKLNETVQLQIVYTPTVASASSGRILIKGNFDDAVINVTSNKLVLPDDAIFEGFEGDVFPPAGWQASKWKQSSASIEGSKSATPSAYYEEKNSLITPRIDASKNPARIEFSYADIYNGEDENGADTSVRLSFSKDGGATWTVIDTFDYNDPYDAIQQKSYTQTANSDNCYWKWDWSLDYYDSEYGANASVFYLDAVVLYGLYGAGDLPKAAVNPVPADGTTEVFNRGLKLEWDPVQFAKGYKLYVGTDAQATSLLNGVELDATATSYDLPKLDYATTYNWKVVPFNATGSAEAPAMWKFTTIADPTVTELPYTEGFDGQFPPKGWNMTGEGYTIWDKNEINPYDGTASAFAKAGYNGKECVLETPDFKVTAPAIASFFWGDGVPVSLLKDESGLKTNTTKGSDGISTVSFQIYSDGEWKQLSLLSDKNNPYWVRERIDLTPYVGKTVAFRWVYTVLNYNQARGAAVDKFSVEASQSENISFNATEWNPGKLNWEEKVSSGNIFTLFNDGSAEVEIADVKFNTPNFTTSLKAGDKIESGKGLVFSIDAEAAHNAADVTDALTVTTKGGSSASLPVGLTALPQDVRFFGFEQDEYGSLAPKGLILVDNDRMATIGLTVVDYAHKYEPMAFVVMNYKKADWPNPYAHTGDQQLTSFAPQNNIDADDWIISPLMTATSSSSLQFFARNYENKDNVGGGEVFGQARPSVLVSEAEDPRDLSKYELVASYTLPYQENDFDYTEINTPIPAKYDGKKIYVAIRHQVTDGLAYFYDDLQYNHFSDFELGVGGIATDTTAIKATVGADGILRVSGVDNASLRVVSMTGATVAAGNGTELDVRDLPAGAYVLTVKTDDALKNIKFIKR